MTDDSVRTATKPSSTASKPSAAVTEELPDEVAPQRATKRVAPVTKTKSTRRLQPGDLVCGDCGEGNPPTRRFCSRCGAELASATVVKVPWYRRFLRRKPRTMVAGTRPGAPEVKRKSGERVKALWRRTMKTVGMFMMLSSLMIVFLPQVRNPVDDLFGNPIDRVQGWWADKRQPYDRVFPVTWEANRRAAPGHVAQAAFDDNTLTFWATRWRPERRLRDTYLTVTFEQPVGQLAVYVHGGAPGEDFAKYHSPRQLRFDYDNGEESDTVTLVRKQGASELLELKHAEGAVKVTIWIEEAHSQRGAYDVAISELEFVQKD